MIGVGKVVVAHYEFCIISFLVDIMFWTDIMLERIPEISAFISCYEAYFHFCEAVNKRKFRYWVDSRLE